jgi:hypothetical protein
VSPTFFFSDEIQEVNANQQSTRSFIDSLFKILFWASKESSANGSVLSQLIFDEISSVLQESPKPIIAQLLKLVLEHLKKSTVPKKGPLPSYLAKIISELVEGLKNQKDGKKLDSQSKSLALELVQLLQSEVRSCAIFCVIFCSLPWNQRCLLSSSWMLR